MRNNVTFIKLRTTPVSEEEMRSYPPRRPHEEYLEDCGYSSSALIRTQHGSDLPLSRGKLDESIVISETVIRGVPTTILLLLFDPIPSNVGVMCRIVLVENPVSN